MKILGISIKINLVLPITFLKNCSITDVHILDQKLLIDNNEPIESMMQLVVQDGTKENQITGDTASLRGDFDYGIDNPCFMIGD